MFSDLHAYVMGDFDKGLFVVSGKLSNGVTMEEAEKGIDEELEKMKTQLVAVDELQKVKNKMEASHVFGEIEVLNKAANLAVSELLGDANMVNDEVSKYLAVTAEQIKEEANKIFRKENCSTLYYKAKK